MSKFIRNIFNNKKTLTLCVAGLIGISFCVGGTTFVYKNYQKAKAEKIALIEEQERIAEEERVRQEKLAREEYFKSSNIAYLTFDDGPNPNTTPMVLDILKKNNIKATFFMLGSMVEQNPELVKRIYEEGHTLANHTTSHNYRYPTKESFLNDIEDTDKKISDAIGVTHKSLFVRCPGGSFNKTMQKDALSENGYIDMNWTALNGDAEKGGNVSKDYALSRIDDTVGDNQYEVILMHDIKRVTTENLQAIIDRIKENGYVFEALTEETPYK